MKRVAWLLILACGCGGGGKSGPEVLMEPRPGTTPVIDGIIGDDEWVDAKTDFTDTLTLYWKHDDTHLFLAVKLHRSLPFNCVDVALRVADDKVINMHTSYQLGEEELTWKDGAWDRRFPGFRLVNTEEKMKEFEETYRWRAAISDASEPGHFEFRMAFNKVRIHTGNWDPKKLRAAVCVTEFKKGRETPVKHPWPSYVDFTQPGSMVDTSKVHPRRWAKVYVRTGWK